jgi:hypothetical protein
MNNTYTDYMEFIQSAYKNQSADLERICQDLDQVYSELKDARQKLTNLGNFSYDDYLQQKSNHERDIR